MSVTVKVKQSFFDRRAIVQWLGKKRASALSKIGAFVRRAARSSMKVRKGPSAPGRPPHAHARHLKDLLFFSFDRTADSVVIGPVPFAKGEAPRLNEFGGSVLRRRRGRMITARYPKRSFMGPALRESVTNAKLKQAWSQSVSARNA